jgi:formamidopyrimidine-DNA glycosylase
MPELPDVENFGRYLKRHALKQTICGVEIGDKRALRRQPAEPLQRRAIGSQFTALRRHGKNLFARLSRGGWIAFHFGMTGYFDYFADGAKTRRHDRVRFDFANGHHLAFVDPRLFGAVGLIDDPDVFIAARRLGPDALDPKLTLRRFKDALGRSGSAKSTLMNQTRIAGIGNLWADEILYQARIHPQTRIARLTDGEIAAMYRTMRRVLPVGIASNAGDEGFVRKLPGSYLLKQRWRSAAQRRCPRCGGPIETLTAAGRTTHICPRCQKPR